MRQAERRVIGEAIQRAAQPLWVPCAAGVSVPAAAAELKWELARVADGLMDMHETLAIRGG